MARLQIELPEAIHFETELQVHIGHINAGGHVDNGQFLILFSEARRQFFAKLGYTEDCVEGFGTTVTDAAIVYKSEAFVGESLQYQLALRDINKYGADIVWVAREVSSRREVARGKNGFVFLAREARRPTPIPPEFLRKLGLA